MVMELIQWKRTQLNFTLCGLKTKFNLVSKEVTQCSEQNHSLAFDWKIGEEKH